MDVIIEELSNELTKQGTEGHLATELLILEYLTRYKPEDQVIRFRYADKLRAIGRIIEAEGILLSLQNSIPREKMYYFHMSIGMLYEDKGEFAKAEHHFRSAADLHGASTAPWVLLGAILDRQGRRNDALDVYQKGLSAQGDVDEVHLNIGNVLRGEGRYEEAIAHYEQAITTSKESDATARKASDAISDLREWARVKANIERMVENAK